MDLYNKYLNKTLHFLSFRGRSEKEIRDYLQKHKAPIEIIRKIIAHCKNYGFINDEKFVLDWIHSRSTYRLKSKRIIKIELIKKGVDPEIIEKVLNNGSDKELNDREQAKKLVEKRLTRYKGLPREVIFQKLAGFLARRGFDWETSKDAIDGVLRLEYNKNATD